MSKFTWNIFSLKLFKIHVKIFKNYNNFVR